MGDRFIAPYQLPDGDVEEGTGSSLADDAARKKARKEAQKRAREASLAEVKAEVAREEALAAERSDPTKQEAARQALGAAVALRQLPFTILTAGGIEVGLSTPKERDAVDTVAATLTNLVALGATTAMARPGQQPKGPSPKVAKERTVVDLGEASTAAEGGVKLGQQERIELFYKNLGEAEAVATADEAHSLLSRTMTAVEDAHSGVEAVAEPGLKLV